MIPNPYQIHKQATFSRRVCTDPTEVLFIIQYKIIMYRRGTPQFGATIEVHTSMRGTVEVQKKCNRRHQKYTFQIFEGTSSVLLKKHRISYEVPSVKKNYLDNIYLYIKPFSLFHSASPRSGMHNVFNSNNNNNNNNKCYFLRVKTYIV